MGALPPRTLDADLRMPALAVGAWTGGLLLAVPLVAAAVLLGAAGAGCWWWRHSGRSMLLGVGIVFAAIGVQVVGRVEGAVVGDSPVAELARQGAVVHVRLDVTSDPAMKAGRFDDYVVLRALVTSVQGRGSLFAARVPAVVIAPESWQHLALGSTVDAFGRLEASDDADVAAVFAAGGPPVIVQGPDLVWRASAAVRRAIREAVAGRPGAAAALVRALVDGDDAGFPDDLADDFRTTGLTHLLAVSGTNLTLVAGFVVVVARWCRVRGRWLTAVAAAGIAAFVVIARAEPSVLRAAAMGTVGLIAMGSNGRQRGIRGLGVAVLVLLLFDPGLARAPGFVLSVLATAGILFLAPGLRDALSAWLPRWLAEAVAVPTAAQLACTPVVAAISGQVSLVAVAANLLAAPAVGPTTVLGLLGGVIGLVVPPGGRLVGWAASLCAAWIVGVARWCAQLPTAAIGWGTNAVSLTLLTVLCVVMAALLPRLLRRRATGVGCSALLAVGVLVPLPTPGWPPGDWVLVACDVGQGSSTFRP